ncbi:Glycogen debranching enzyme [Thalassoglobus neptunius]|uniref:Glycogen debranching enzyme n=1 Tax=Thalassoglobus neptunius TaxID=1938619 RepID=A0A5C5X5C6_9PLAN|nr:glycogen debranching protein GlgX [Thalassoglobus neptunius]TWT58226.1 Glycogen debranching enzyme [Thalassoglobus neptunius]
MNQDINSGQTSPLGAHVRDGGVNFSLYSRHATRVEILFFDHDDDAVPSRVVELDPASNRTYHYWHVFVAGVHSGQRYGYRIHGPYEPEEGLRFDPTKLLLDPYGKCVAYPQDYSRELAESHGENLESALKSVVVDPELYDWEGDQPLRHSATQTIIYELHVKGFTSHPNSEVDESRRGTYLGLIEKIPYLQSLGITAVELLPVFQFDPQDAPPGKSNYWGYAPISFFAPHHAYRSRNSPLAAVDEFRDMVKAFHQAGIEVILDVVFNHTAEGNENGPTLCFRGIDNPVYYMLEAGKHYANYTGCGNTLNANHSVVRRMIVDSLKYWVKEMHIDGFRFDLASILSRDSDGTLMPSPPVLWDIESDPDLAGTKLLAEAWDAAGLYQVGSFVGDYWCEWNGKFRDDVRDFFRCQPGAVRRISDRIVGSPQIYAYKGREVEQSVNFVTCHDGFTLNDLVSYNNKHNELNGEDNRDGSNDNRSWNCGVEGPTDDPDIESLRNRQVKNFHVITLMALGMPMLTMGDEVRRTQRGNNNVYCQDNEIGWFDWDDVHRHEDIYRFVSLLCRRRVQRMTQHKGKRVTLVQLLSDVHWAWHGVKVDQPDWSCDSHCIALQGHVRPDGLSFHLILNGFWEPKTFELPPLQGGRWNRWIDTSLATPNDIVPWESAVPVRDDHYLVESHSVALLISKGIPA